MSVNVRLAVVLAEVPALDAGNDPWSFNHSDTTAKGKRLDAVACTVDSADIIKSYKPNNNEQWIENGDSQGSAPAAPKGRKQPATEKTIIVNPLTLGPR